MSDNNNLKDNNSEDNISDENVNTQDENIPNDNDILNDDKIPNEFLCPITLDIMREPIVMPDGHTYEKEAIKQVLEIYHVSPLTKMPMEFSDGVINYSLKSLIETYIKEHNLQLTDVNITEKIKNLNITEVKKIEQVEFEELFSRYISEEQSDNLCKDSIHVCMKPKKIKTTLSICLICVVDISGSMSVNCCQNINGMESMRISRLELIKHSLKTIVSTLRKDDMISVITFHTKAAMKVKPTILINKEEKESVINSINEMIPLDMTNMWDGIRMAIDTSSSIPYENYQKSIMVFTDGESNSDPPKGVYETLKETLQSCDDKFTISTFSFGNDIRPKLLIDIANLCNGIYGYCPDGTMVGTIFINYMSNLLSTITPIVKVTVTQGDNTKKTMTIGPLYRGSYRNAIFKIDRKLLNKTKVIVELPMNQQIFEVPINFDSPNLQSYIKEMEDLENKQNKLKKENDDDNDDDDDDDELLDKESESGEVVKVKSIDTNILIEEKDSEPIKYEEMLFNQLMRNKFIITLNKIVKLEKLANDNKENEKAKKILKEYIDLLNGLKYKTQFIKSLIIDIEDLDPNHGQVEKAINQTYFKTWGECYINSFLRFHQFEQCGNFKDQSLQHYTNSVFSTYRRMAHTIFINLPPPTATRHPVDTLPQPYTYSAPRRSYRRVRGSFLSKMFGMFSNAKNSSCSLRVCTESCPIDDEPPDLSINMSSFLDRHGGCFNGDAIVSLANGQTKCVKDLKKGDRLNNNSIVQCLIEQQTSNRLSKSYMCDIQGVLFTPYHPILVNNTWYFPIDLVEAKLISINSWFNLILMDEANQKYEVEFINGVKAITLGHCRNENDILKHPYFGSELVLKDLKERDPIGYFNGYIFIKNFNPRQLQFDNQYCINYYKVLTEIGNTNNIDINNHSERLVY
ncbi:hypothetical protein BCR32DRAFT_324277 [Anaeromyces robustus]|uniref:VWFA domain-containing protein n=1 Tax=Anaeromyces robustus TaxID=1754192 RepID=A0A1Y1XPR2_9FUNG|nr:hypothetical protein BCR32DRAFT_324277 [Anaeromyces robustus]|eukprot:ORX87749.1 hypothetical protein BCR32DRAFT_324277 [Anaeromyces robustus]